MTQETIRACESQVIRYIPLYLPDPNLPDLSTFEMVQITAPLIAAAFGAMLLALTAWWWLKFVEVGVCVWLVEEQVFIERSRQWADATG